MRKFETTYVKIMICETFMRELCYLNSGEGCSKMLRGMGFNMDIIQRIMREKWGVCENGKLQEMETQEWRVGRWIGDSR